MVTFNAIGGKMKRQKLNSILAIVLILSLALFISCEAKKNTADMRITMEKEVSRTYTPTDVNLSITNYELTCTSPSNEIFKYTTKRNTFILEGVALGEWNIKVDGKNDNGTVLVSGSTTFNLNDTNTNATVILNELKGTGNVSLTYSWNSSLVKSPKLVITFKGVDNTENRTIEPPISSGAAVLSLEGIPAGSYTSNAILYDGSVQVSGAIDAVRVVDAKTTAGSISLNLDDAPAIAGHITLENKVGTPVNCIITGIENGQVLTAQKKYDIELDTQGISAEDITIQWYLDGKFISSDKKTSITPVPGMHRLDIIANTKMLGSTGSTQINFEAAVLGVTGQPVLAGVIENGDIKIGGRTNIDFLPDGKLLIVSDTYQTASICSIVRNSLKLENSVAINKAIKKVRVLNTGNIVAMISDSDNSALRWTYDKNTCSLINLVNCAGNIYPHTAALKFDRIYDIVHPGSWVTGSFGVIGYGDEVTAISLRHLTNSNTTPGSSDNFVRSGRTVNYGSLIDYSITASSDDGDCIGYVNPEGKAAGSKAINGTLKTKAFEDSRLVGASAIAIMNSPDTESIRYAVAVGDSFVICKGNLNSGLSVVGTVSRTEDGSSLNTNYMFTDKKGTYLYALNTGDNSISQYLMEDDSLTFVAKTDLEITPQRAAISNSGVYMFITGNDSSKILMMKINTQSE